MCVLNKFYASTSANLNCHVYVRRLDMSANPLLLTVLLVGSCLLTAAQAPAPAPNGSEETSPLTASSQPVCTSMLGGTNVSLIMVADPGDFTGTGDVYTGCTRHLWQERTMRVISVCHHMHTFLVIWALRRAAIAKQIRLSLPTFSESLVMSTNMLPIMLHIAALHLQVKQCTTWLTCRTG